ncbi:putative Nop domain-containing protein [Rosa chinensis]|uniref:Nucleolar protein 58 n=1 Tax=Rosa chinensis TaxID=74649 RepID=A0A2P6R6C5_ROSCH|nr:probable nucleolar protein 5-2 [Rosa chinensis]XP_024188638.1 probable nucleolar protein 5-2 [Rosa chinensis]PRQ41978.1 putative Nop domain-containing protein [Rosa chinensis]
MLLLFENPGGFMLFKVLKDDGKFTKAEAQDIAKEFATGESARKVVKLKAFSKFENMSEALEAATMLIESKTTKDLRKFLKKHCEGEILGVADSKLGNIIKEKLKIECVHDNAVMELMRGVRSQLTELITGLQVQDMAPMSLGLSHSLSRYKLKFSADKVDTMVIQAIGLLDDLDKELNTYAMRVREWYGWHFPELAKIVQDNIAYAKVVKLMGFRVDAAKLDFSEILSDEVETELKEAAVISMGTEISDLDLINIKELCEQVLSLAEYRAQLFDYLKTRMNTIAPNLTALVGELVGARLIAHGGSLVNLAKQPGSTIQILGAEKALFRALKTKHATPKYGLIYHASLVGQAAPKLKGKISRTLASKAVLSIRIDALREGDSLDNSVGVESRGKVEARIRSLEGKALSQSAGSAKGKPLIEAYDKDRKKGAGGLITAAKAYNPAADSVLGQTTPAGKTAETMEEAPGDKKEKKKRKKDDDEDMPQTNDNVEPESEEPVKKEKKKKKKSSAEDVEVQNGEGEKKKRKRKHAEEEEESEAPSKKKEKKKKKKTED